MKVSVILLAGGSSKRFGTNKKQFVIVNGKQILDYSLETFSKLNFVKQIIVVLPKENFKDAQKKLNNYQKVFFTVGGKERYNSVQKGLKLISSKIDYVAIHDAARPLVSREIVLRCVKEIKKYDCVIPAVKVEDTLKVVNKNLEVVKHLDREKIFTVQTPQMFKRDVVEKIYSEEVVNKWNKKYKITDDSQLATLQGYKVKVVLGDKKNFKITTQEDLNLFKLYLTT